MDNSQDYYLQFDSVSKSFPGVQALDNISFGIKEGSIHGLVGENGAGKSTLLKILSGAYKPTSGQIILNGTQHVFHNTGEAINSGISVIYQELNLVPDMTVEENLFLGNMPGKYGFIKKKEMRELALKELNLFGENIVPGEKIKNLSIGQRQMVEIAKSLLHDVKVIALDEPTSSLSDREVNKLFSVIRDLQKKKCVIIYISHRLEEVFETCDSITVLRDGKLIVTFENMAELNRDILVNKMVGRPIKDIYNYTPRKHTDVALEVQDIYGPGLAEPASFNVTQGEITGFFGLVGAGRSELMKLVYGAAKKVSGEVKLYGKSLNIRNPRDSIENGICLCPEDRKLEGIIPIASIVDNINISVRRLFSWLGFFIDREKETQNTKQYVEQLNIKTPSLEQFIMYLSGGNQQKVILARWLSEKAKLIIIDEPTRGIDVGTKSDIYSIIYRLAEQGLSVIIVSSDLPEILGICDRIIVMSEGSIVKSLNRDEATQENVLSYALPCGSNV